jgi:phosphoglycerate-specific signal transduction histidine kinase
MDELLAKQLLRQLRILNTFLIGFAVTFLILFIVAGVFMYKAYREVQDAKESLNSLQQKVQGSVDIKAQLCDSKSTISDLIKNRSEICQ